MKIAFVGLGNMGLPMALNLLKSGYAVTGFDLAAPALQALQDAGGQAAASAADAAFDAEVVISMLPASKHVHALYVGTPENPGLLGVVRPGALLIDCSTIAPETAREVAQAATEAGLAMLDAPVSGGTGGAAAATLTFMVGGAAAALERATPLLAAMGKNIFHAGGNGAGQTVKVCNNMLLGILMLGTCEAIRLGQANGMDPATLSAIMAKSSGRNWALEVYNPCPGVMDNVPAARGYSGGFGVDLMLKDLGLAVANAQANAVSTPLGELAHRLYSLHSQAGHGALDFSSVFTQSRPALQN